MNSKNSEGTAHASPKQVAIATLVAVLISGFVLLAFILPAEFGTDPLGSGELLGLTALSRAGENPLENQSIQHKTDYREFILEPFQSIEYKYLMDLGSTMVFSWEADGELYYDFHADPSTPGEEDVASFEIGDSNSAQGTYHALFSGIHGWFWENRSLQEVTIRLHSAGFYINSIVFQDGGSFEREIPELR
ncbi:MAG: hypothetical protein RQ757_01630 [Pseudomonadales bacterium]|nr:hypothetical protein [Pseudomonadales bacterium]